MLRPHPARERSSEVKVLEPSGTKRWRTSALTCLDPPGVRTSPNSNEKGRNGPKVIWAIDPANPIPLGEPIVLKFSYEGEKKGGFVFLA